MFFLWIKWHISQAILSASFLLLFLQEKDNLQKKASYPTHFTESEANSVKGGCIFMQPKHLLLRQLFFVRFLQDPDKLGRQHYLNFSLSNPISPPFLSIFSVSAFQLPSLLSPSFCQRAFYLLQEQVQFWQLPYY